MRISKSLELASAATLSAGRACRVTVHTFSMSVTSVRVACLLGREMPPSISPTNPPAGAAVRLDRPLS